MRTFVPFGVLCVLGACGDDASGPGGPRCSLVGERVVLPTTSSNFDVAAASDGWVVLLSDSEGMGALHVGNDGTVGAREDVGLPIGITLNVVNADGTIYATTPSSATFDGLRIAKREGGTWTTDTEPGVEGDSSFTSGSAVAVRGNAIAVVFVAGAGSSGEQQIHVIEYGPAGFGASTIVPKGGIPTIEGVEVEAAFDGAGTLWVVVGGRVGDAFHLFAYSRSGSGTWSDASDLGAIEGSFQNISIAGMGFDGSEVNVVVVEPADFFEDTNGRVRVIGVNSERDESGPLDPRPVVEGVDVAPMSGFGLLATACWGANNFDFAQSDDDVVLYACVGSCRKVLDVDPTKGTFYGAAQVATRGQDGIVVYNREPKGPDGGEQQTVAQRFSCPMPE